MYDEPEHAQDRFLMVAQKFGTENHSRHLHFKLHFKNLTKHSDNIFFHRWGIGEVDSDALYQRAMRDYAYRKKYGDKKLDELRKWKVSKISKIHLTVRIKNYIFLNFVEPWFDQAIKLK